MSNENQPLIPAATVVLLRDHPDGDQVLMLHRDHRLAFAAGAWVFPGGRVDPADFGDNPHDLDAAERAAAIREVWEETGLVINAESLTRWSHWKPPPQGVTRRFATAYFLAEAPTGEVVVDHGEIRDHQWVRPEQAIELHHQAQIELTPPTYITLRQLIACRSVRGVLAGTTPHVVELFTSKFDEHDGTIVAMYHGDAGYDTGDATVAGARHRLVIAPQAWSYVRDTASGEPTRTSEHEPEHY